MLRALEIPGLVALPAIVFWLTPNVMTVAGNLDTFLYTGYMVNLHRLVERYDVTYYMLRMAVLLPGEAIYRLFGPQTGFFVLHFLQVLVGSTSAYLIAKRFYGAGVAWFSAAVLCLSPWYLRPETWDYVDGFALNYLFAGLAFILVPRCRRPVWYACAGACFALATNSNLYAVAIWGAFLPSWLVIVRRMSWRALVTLAVAFLAGFVVAYAGLAVAVNDSRPGLGPFFELRTIQFAEYLLGGGSAPWYQPLNEFLNAGHYYYILAPAAVAIAGAVFFAGMPSGERWTEKGRLTGAFLLYLVIVVAIYLVNHFAFHSPRITRFYYFCYLVIPSHLVLTTMIGQLYARRPAMARVLLVIAIVAAVVLWQAYGFSAFYRAIPYGAFIVSFIVLVLGSTAGMRLVPVALVCVLACWITLPALFLRTSPDHAELEQRGLAVLEHDVYAEALNLIKVVETTSPPSAGPLAFWYPDEDDKYYWYGGSLQGTYLYLYSRLKSTNPPAVNDKLLHELAGDKVLVILGIDPEQVDQGLAALHKAGVATQTVAQSVYRGHIARYAYIVAKLTRVPRDSR